MSVITIMFDFVNNIGGLAGLGILCAGLGFAYSQFKSGSSKAKDELITTLKETATVEREKSDRLTADRQTLIKNHQEQINELNLKIGNLQGRAEASEKKLNEYMDILKGRNPEQEKFMKYMLDAANTSSKYMKESSAILKEISIFMNKSQPNE